MNENVQKFYGIDKYKKEVGNLKEESSKNISDTIIIAKLKLNEEKLAKATETYNHVKPLIADFDVLGPNKIAKTAYDSGWLKNAALSKSYYVTNP